MQESWKRIEELFHGALELPLPSDREAWLEKECRGDADLKREVLSLLASAREADTHALAGRIGDAARQVLDVKPARGSRTHAGPYRLLRVLGQGGMGTVHLAERDDGQFHRIVAVKLVRRGMDTDFILRRFRRERQILARLDHPNIGRLLDGGTTEDGTPYLVMEYIDGLPITRHCDENRHSVKQRLRLFLEVCSAVHYAHANLVIHRDLKPGNILVDREGRAKLLDFGICKLLVRETVDSAISFSGDFPAMTPEYASPEQVRGDAITVASDVYSLGAVLYQLLTGTRAVRLTERSPQAVEEAVCRQSPRPPSEAARDSRRPGAVARARQLEGDLDEILLRALQKDTERRYRSAEQLADDLRRHLEHRPVGARALTPGYRVRKFVRRNRVGVAAALGISLAFTAGLALSARQAREARHDLHQLREADASLVSQLGDSVQATSDAGTRRELARRTSEYLDRLASRSAGDDSLELELARAYLRLGELAVGPDAESFAIARSTFGRARELSERLLARAPVSREARDVRDRALQRLGRLGVP